MKSLIVSVLLCCLLVGGCDVIMSAGYQTELNREVALIAATYKGVEDGKVSSDELGELLVRMYMKDREWQDAMKLGGVPTDKAKKDEYKAALRRELTNE